MKVFVLSNPMWDEYDNEGIGKIIGIFSNMDDVSDYIEKSANEYELTFNNPNPTWSNHMDEWPKYIAEKKQEFITNFRINEFILDSVK